jgi:two-component system, LytTR family, sensor kinase
MILAFVGWWTFWILFQSFVLHHLGLSWRISLIDAAVSNAVLALAGFASENSLKYYQPAKGNTGYRLAWGLVIAFICAAAARFVLRYIFVDTPSYLTLLEYTMPLRFMYFFLMVSIITMIGWLWFYIKEQQEAQRRKQDAEALLRDAELSNLRQQLQPHFLFNSLNSISALAGSQPAEARKMIQQLSEFLRGTLKKDDQTLVRLDDELNHLHLYLEIEKVRFGHRLKTDIQIQEGCESLHLPSLLIQPVVENAIKFGLYDTTGEVTIKIKAHCESHQLLLEVQNPFDPTTAHPRKGSGFGLTSVQRRLYLLYARQDLLSVESSGNIFITRLKIPQKK